MKTDLPSNTRAIVGFVLLGCSQSSGSGDAVSFSPDAGPTAARGAAAVESWQCGRCHQSPDPRDGLLSGQTAPLEGTRSYPSNLTPDPDTGMDAWDADTIATSVLDGVDDQGALLCPPMPAYASVGMQYDEALSIAVYLQSLSPVRHEVPASVCAVKVGKEGGP